LFVTQKGKRKWTRWCYESTLNRAQKWNENISFSMNASYGKEESLFLSQIPMPNAIYFSLKCELDHAHLECNIFFCFFFKCNEITSNATLFFNFTFKQNKISQWRCKGSWRKNTQTKHTLKKLTRTERIQMQERLQHIQARTQNCKVKENHFLKPKIQLVKIKY
jgi:hypothetical protein